MTTADRRGDGQLALAAFRLGQRRKEISVNNRFGVDSLHGNRSADRMIDIEKITGGLLIASPARTALFLQSR